MLAMPRQASRLTAGTPILTGATKREQIGAGVRDNRPFPSPERSPIMNRRKLRTLLRSVLYALAALDPLAGQWPITEAADSEQPDTV